jgi:molybdate transport system substrate-binding protein
VVFASNRLVLAVPKDSQIRSLADIARPGVKLAVGAPSVPVGSYTREVLDRLPASQRKAMLANVRSNEPDVASVVAKLAQGAADAGFVYVTDVVATKGALRATELPPRLRPSVAYGAAVVTRSRHPDQARVFVSGLRSGGGSTARRRAGFAPPP